MTRLEAAAHVSVVILCLCAVGLVIEKRYGVQAPAGRPGPERLVGKRFDVPGALWTKQPVNAALILSTKCKHCQASLPFYRDLVAERDRLGIRASVVVVSRYSPEQISEFLHCTKTLNKLRM